MIMRMFHSWRDSLALLAPKTFKPLALVTLKSIIDTYKVLFKVWYLWVVPAAFLIVRPYLHIHGWRRYVVDILGSEKNSMSGYIIVIWTLTFLCAKMWYIVTTSLAARPSVRQKKIDYFISYLRYFVILLVVSFVIKLISFSIAMYKVDLYHKIGHLGMKDTAAHIIDLQIWGDPFSSFFMFYLLFFLDSDGSLWQAVYSFVRAIKMFIFNLPLIIILYVPLTIYEVAIGGMPLIVFQVITWLLVPVTVCIWVTLFTKRLHDQPDLYFSQPK